MFRKKFIDRLREKYRHGGVHKTQFMPQTTTPIIRENERENYVIPNEQHFLQRTPVIPSEERQGVVRYSPVSGLQVSGMGSNVGDPGYTWNKSGKQRTQDFKDGIGDYYAAKEFNEGGMYDQMLQYKMGGTKLPGGEMQPIPGSDAVQFNGQSHEQGGIMLDPQTEVEGGETMDQVNMAKKGGKRDYFFSDHLKKGGKSFADLHKEILANGGDQEEINMLARMQEKAAGRNPKQVAKLGGVMKYEGGGYTTDTSNQVNDNMLAHRYKILEDIEDGKPIYNEIDNNEFIDPDDLNDKGDAESFLNNFFKKYDKVEENNEEIIEEEKPPVIKKKTPVNKKKTTVNKDSSVTREPESIITLPTVQPKLIEAEQPTEELLGGGLSDAEIEEMIRTNGSDKEKSFLAKLKERFLQGDVPLAAYTAGIAQLAPAAYAIFHKQDDAEQSVYTPGFTSPIIAERGKASTLERVNYNAERSRNAADMRGINKFIETSGGGPANIINKMSAYARKQEGDMKITAAETRANADIANREAQMKQQMAISNMQRAQQASTTNAQLSRAETARMDQIEQMNAQARQKLKDDQEAMKYQGIGLAAQGIAGLAGDVMSYQAQERLARSIGTDGVYQRDRLRNLFRKANPDATEEEINMLVANYTNNTLEAQIAEKKAEAEKYKNIING